MENFLFIQDLLFLVIGFFGLFFVIYGLSGLVYWSYFFVQKHRMHIKKIPRYCPRYKPNWVIGLKNAFGEYASIRIKTYQKVIETSKFLQELCQKKCLAYFKDGLYYFSFGDYLVKYSLTSFLEDDHSGHIMISAEIIYNHKVILQKVEKIPAGYEKDLQYAETEPIFEMLREIISYCYFNPMTLNNHDLDSDIDDFFNEHLNQFFRYDSYKCEFKYDGFQASFQWFKEADGKTYDIAAKMEYKSSIHQIKKHILVAGNEEFLSQMKHTLYQTFYYVLINKSILEK